MEHSQMAFIFRVPFKRTEEVINGIKKQTIYWTKHVSAVFFFFLYSAGLTASFLISLTCLSFCHIPCVFKQATKWFLLLISLFIKSSSIQCLRASLLYRQGTFSSSTSHHSFRLRRDRCDYITWESYSNKAQPEFDKVLVEFNEVRDDVTYLAHMVVQVHNRA